VIHSRSVAAGVFLSLGLGLGLAAAIYWSHTRGLARVSLAVTTSDGQALRGSVRVVEIEPITGVAGATESLGRLELEDERLRPGWKRFLVELDAVGVLEIERQLETGTREAVRVVVGPSLPGNDGMIRVEGGMLSLRDGPDSQTGLNGRDIPVAAFWLDACEVSNGEYRRFLEDTGHVAPRHWAKIDPKLYDSLPVVWVGWQDARAYAEWCGKRLPTYAEWMWAARGSEGRLYPWPEDPEGKLHGNVEHPVAARISAEEDTANYLQFAAPVRSSPDACTESGIFNLFGNVAEWTASPFAWRSQGEFVARPAQRYIAGQCWEAAQRHYTLKVVAFDGIDSNCANARTGFRCARSDLHPPSQTRRESLGDHQEAGRTTERGQRSGPARDPR